MIGIKGNNMKKGIEKRYQIGIGILLCVALLCSSCDPDLDWRSFTLADGTELVAGDIDTASLSSQLFEVTEFHQVIQHWEPVRQGDGGGTSFYLFGEDMTLFCLSKSDDKAQDWDGFSLKRSAWSLKKDGENLSIGEKKYTVYPDLPDRIYLRNGKQVICLQKVSSDQADYLRKKIADLL